MNTRKPNALDSLREEPAPHVDLSTFRPKTADAVKAQHIDQEAIRTVGEASGFVSRSPVVADRRKRRRAGNRSPYTDQVNIKVRPEMKERWFQLCQQFDRDYEAFEAAIEALERAQG